MLPILTWCADDCKAGGYEVHRGMAEGGNDGLPLPP
jgi:hypothetical protein